MPCHCLICDNFRVDRGYCAGAKERLRSSYPSSGDWGSSALRCFPGSVRDAIVHPWTGGVGAEELLIAPHVLRQPDFTVGGLISPSSCLLPVLADLVRTSTASSRHPLLLRALLPYSNYMIAVPLPANNYFLNVLTSATGPSLYLWFCLSAAAEYLISQGLQPAPRSACLEPLISFPDWEEFTSTFVTDTEP